MNKKTNNREMEKNKYSLLALLHIFGSCFFFFFCPDIYLDGCNTVLNLAIIFWSMEFEVQNQ